MTIRDPWIALQFDQAVVYFGVVIENALSERETMGTGKEQRSAPKYTLKQLLRDDFQLPAPGADGQSGGRGVGSVLRAMVGRGVKLLKGG